MIFLSCFWIILSGLAAQEISFRITGGQPTSIEQYPSLVQVEEYGLPNAWYYICAASILTEKYVLSAAHCFYGDSYKPANVRIRAGTEERGKGGVIVYVKHAFNHPSYFPPSDDSDITVVLLATPLTYSSEIKPASIAVQGTVVPDDTEVVVAGWGRATDYGVLSKILLVTTVYTVNNKLCASRYLEKKPVPVIVTENMICAGSLDGSRDACAGDSGAPLFHGKIVVGVVAFGAKCGSAFFPGGYTDVAKYADWISSIIY